MTVGPFTADPTWAHFTTAARAADVADIVADRFGRLHVLTRKPAGVVVLDPAGNEIETWGADALVHPSGLVVHDDGAIVVDENDHTVKLFDAHHELDQVLGTSGRPSDTGYDSTLSRFTDRQASIRQSAGPFNLPTRADRGPDGCLFVTDGYGNGRVHCFDPEGSLVRSWGETGNGPGQFKVPHDIVIDPYGQLLVADRENDRIQIFDRDGTLLDIWDDLRRPAAIALDPSGTVYVTEFPYLQGHYSWRKGHVEPEPASLAIVDAGGRVLDRLWRPDGRQPGGFLAPHAIAVDADGSLYVGEVLGSSLAAVGIAGQGGHTLQKLTPLSRHTTAKER